MYSFETGVTRRKDHRHIRILTFLVILLAVLLAVVGFSYTKAKQQNSLTTEAIASRVYSDIGDAQTAAYRLTQSSGSSTISLLSQVRSRIYAIQGMNALASSIYGAGTIVVDATLLDECIDILDECELRLQAGSVLTEYTTALRDKVDEIAATLGLSTISQ